MVHSDVGISVSAANRAQLQLKLFPCMFFFFFTAALLFKKAEFKNVFPMH